MTDPGRSEYPPIIAALLVVIYLLPAAIYIYPGSLVSSCESAQEKNITAENIGEFLALTRQIKSQESHYLKSNLYPELRQCYGQLQKKLGDFYFSKKNFNKALECYNEGDRYYDRGCSAQIEACRTEISQVQSFTPSAQGGEGPASSNLSNQVQPNHVNTNLNPGDRVNIMALSFIDAFTMAPLSDKELAASIDIAVGKGIELSLQNNDKLAKEKDRQEKKENGNEVRLLAGILFDPNLTKIEKINRIIVNLMNPVNADAVVSGYYIEKPHSPMITIRPLIIIKSNQAIVLENIQFTREELLRTDPVSNRKTLCSGAADQIAQAVKGLLMRL
ncbi:MAG: LETM1 domain-containing protein [Candidatus Aminicenantes bacterium]|nr:LETM1 domain-containing protein [Candidatus Aminicenantes bacterium]